MNEESRVSEINDLRKIIKDILLKKSLTENEKNYLKECITRLVGLTNNEDPKSLVLLGKINSRLNNYNEAIINFNDAISINPLLASPYYGLFKISIDRCNYNEALKDIELYGLYSGIDVSVYKNLLHVLLNIDAEPINSVDNIFGNYKLYYPILLNYNLAIDSINENEYETALKHITTCIKLINKYNYHIDLSFLEKILKKIVLNQKDLKREKEILDLIQLYFATDNLGTNYLCLKNLLSFDTCNINVLISLIECSILFSDYNGAKKYLELALSIDSENKRLEYIQNKISFINKSNQENLRDIKNKGKINNLIDMNKIDDAINLCTYYFELLKDPYYLYYAGKILYNHNDMNRALTFFKDYLAIGKAYFKEAYYYLFFIYYRLNDTLLADYYANLILELSQYDGIEFKLEELKDYLLAFINHFDDCSIFKLEKLLLQASIINDAEIKKEKVILLRNNKQNVK